LATRTPQDLQSAMPLRRPIIDMPTIVRKYLHRIGVISHTPTVRIGDLHFQPAHRTPMRIISAIEPLLVSGLVIAEENPRVKG
jgi:hypothetical protein